MEYPPIEAIVKQIQSRYLFSEMAITLAATLDNTYFEASSEIKLAEKITAFLIDTSGDRHFFLRYAPDELAGQTNHETVMQANGERALEILEGNIGYWHLTELAPFNAVADLFQSAMSFLQMLMP